MWELDHKESWGLKNWCLWTVVLEKTPESPLDDKEIKPVNPKGNQSRILIGRTDTEAEAPIFWPPDEKSRFIGKDSDVGKIEGKRRREQQRMNWLDSIINSMDMNLSKLWEIVEDRGAWSVAVHGAAKSQTQLSDWRTTMMPPPPPLLPGLSLLYTTSWCWIDWVLFFSLLICLSRLQVLLKPGETGLGFSFFFSYIFSFFPTPAFL